MWKRLSEIYKPNELNILKEPATIKENPEILSEDVMQGDIGDCYFLSVLSSLALNPKRIKNLFPNLNISPNGLFEARIFIDGEAVNVVVDDYFPFIEKEDGTFELAFAGINHETNNIWPMILEKIWAKVNFVYENIIKGDPSDAFEFLTPSPFNSFYHNIHHEEIFNRIVEACEKNYVASCAINADGNVSLADLVKMGLLSNHAYSILGYQ